MISHELGCVQRSWFCHFPSSAATITWQPSAASTHCVRATLCLHTEFNHSSPHLHREDGSEERRKGESLWGGMMGRGWEGGRRSQKGTEVKLGELAVGVLEQEGK